MPPCRRLLDASARSSSPSARSAPGGRAGEPHLPVDVLVEEITERPRSAGVAGLRAERPKPHEVARLDLDPVAVQPVDALALEHEETVLHDVRLREGDHAARLEG